MCIRDRAYHGSILRIAKLGDNSVSELVNLTFEEREYGEVSSPHTVLEGPDAIGFMQAVMDAAFEFGLRPSGALDEKHIQAHLSDMRAITRHVLKMDK